MDLKAHAFEGFPEDRGHARPPAHSLDIKSFCQSENHCVPNEINSKVPPPPKKKLCAHSIVREPLGTIF